MGELYKKKNPNLYRLLSIAFIMFKVQPPPFLLTLCSDPKLSVCPHHQTHKRQYPDTQGKNVTREG